MSGLPEQDRGGAVAVATHGLSMRYGSETALAGVDLRIPEGAVYILIGPNGAGKSTAMKVLLNLERPDAGRAEVFGLDTASRGPEVRAQVGYIPEHHEHAYGWMTCGRLIQHVAAHYPGRNRARRDAARAGRGRPGFSRRGGIGMMQSTLHPTPRGRNVVRKQVRIVGLGLRREALIAAVVLGIVTLAIAIEIVRGGAVMHFDSWDGTALVALLFPFAVWKGEKRFGPAFLWTLPVDRRPPPSSGFGAGLAALWAATSRHGERRRH